MMAAHNHTPPRNDRSILEFKAYSARSLLRRGREAALEPALPLAGVLVIAPIAFASSPAWAWHGLAVLMGVNLGWWAMCALRVSGPPALSWRRHGVTTVLGLLFLGWLAVQATSLSLVPDSWRHPIWREMSEALATDVDGAISVDPNTSWDSLISMMLYASVFWIAMHYSRARNGARQLLTVVAATGAMSAAYGLLVRYGGVGGYLWPANGSDTVTGTFPDSQGLALYMTLCLITAVGLLSSRHDVKFAAPLVSRAALYRMVGGFKAEVAAHLLAALVMSCALFLTASPAGGLAAVVGLAVLAAARALTRGARLGRSMLLGLLVIAAGLGAIHLSGDDRIGAMLIEFDRHSRPIMGWGMGAEPTLTVQNGGIPLGSSSSQSMAHRFIDQAGLPGALWLFGTLGWVAAACIRGCLIIRREAAYSAVALSASIAFGAHALLSDAGMTPATGVTLAAVLGIGFAQSWAEDGRSGDSIARR